MKTRWNFLMVLVLLATLAGGSVAAAQAPGGITGISPEDGAVGTQVIITGAGFGDKQGEVMLGTEKNKVLAWSDTEITFLIDKPQPAGKYTLAILLHGDKQPLEQLTFPEFRLQRPRINQDGTGLIRDGSSLTILGQFFGDKKGEVGVAFLQGEQIVIESAKVLDWSMSSIRCELPDRLTGKFILKVGNEVGMGFALWDQGEGLLGYPPPPPGWRGEEEQDGATGIYYNGRLYVFSIHPYDCYGCEYDLNYVIRLRTFDPNTGEFSDYYKIPRAESYVTASPVVIDDRLWVFYTSQNNAIGQTDGKIYYTIYTPGEWTDWKEVPGAVLSENAMVSPVYDERYHRLSLYYPKDGVTWMYTDDFGTSWSNPQQVGGRLTGFHQAIYWPSATTTALAATSEGVIALKDGEYRGNIMTDDLSPYRPYLVDMGWGLAMLYGKSTDWDTYPMIRTFDYSMWSWSEPKSALEVPDLSPIYGHYEFDQAPRGAIHILKNASGEYERRMYLFYNTGLEGWYSDPPSVFDWYIYDSGMLASDVPPGPPLSITPTVFTQVSSGEQHSCGLKDDGVVECWGKNEFGQAAKPNGTFLQISAGNWTNCGVKTDHSIACWGKNDYNLVSSLPSGTNFTQVSVGLMVACGLKADKTVVCWGDKGDGRLTSQSGMTQISAGQWHTCGLRTDGSVYCWGDDGGTGRKTPPENTKFTLVSAAAWHTCGITEFGDTVCWGNNDVNRVRPVPPLAEGLTYRQVSTGNWHTCGLVSDGSVRCWGTDDDKRISSTPSSGIYSQIEAGIRNTCALREDGSITCWGRNSEGQTWPPF